MDGTGAQFDVAYAHQTGRHQAYRTFVELFVKIHYPDISFCSNEREVDNSIVGG